MKKLILFFLLPFIFGKTYGQKTFERRDSTDLGLICCPSSQTILQTLDKGYISGGLLVQGTNARYYWERLDSNGYFQSGYAFGYWADSYLHSISLTRDSGFIICGNASASWFPMGVIKINSNGVPVWHKIFGLSGCDLYGFCARQTLDGNYIIAGSKHCFGIWDAELTKLDSIGNTIWSKTYGSVLSREYFFDIIETEDSGYVAVGSSDQGIAQIFIIRTDSDGDTIWTKRFQDGFNFSEGVSLTKTFDHGFVIACSPKSTWSGPFGSALIKIDSAGNLVWKKDFGAGDSLFINNVVQTSDSGFIFSGVFENTYSGCIVKTNFNGDTLWSKSLKPYIYGGICQTSDNGYAVAGSSCYTFKTDEFGNTQCWSQPLNIGISYSGLTPIYDTVNVFPDSLPLLTLGVDSYAFNPYEIIICNSVGVPELHPNTIQYNISPNPSRNILQIDSEIEIYKIEIYDGYGRLLKKYSHVSFKSTIDISDLNPTIYFIKVFTPSGNSTSKFIKQ